MKRKILKYLGILFIIIGLAIIIYPFYNNFILVKRETAILSSWDEDLTSLHNISNNEENTSEKKTRQPRTAKNTTNPNDEPKRKRGRPPKKKEPEAE